MIDQKPPTLNDESVEPPQSVWLHVYADADCWCSYHDLEDGQADKTLTKFTRADLPTTTAINPVVMRAIAHELLRRFMGVYDTGDLDDAITILTKHLSGEAGKQEGE